MSGPEAKLQIEELSQICDEIQKIAGLGAEVIFGYALDPMLKAQIKRTFMASGFPESQ